MDAETVLTNSLIFYVKMVSKTEVSYDVSEGVN